MAKQISEEVATDNIFSARARYLPFAVFMAFIGIEELLRLASGRGLLNVSKELFLYIYPCKVLIVSSLLFFYRSHYQELSWHDVKDRTTLWFTLAAGIIVFLVWIRLDWVLSSASTPAGFNPYLLPQHLQIPMTAVRVFGAVLLVPVMEELFWRSFLLRYLIRHDFQNVPIGHYTFGSFIATVILFGLEHHLIAAGMFAGVVYNLLLYRTKRLAHVVVAHALTNLLLAIYVLKTGKWEFW